MSRRRPSTTTRCSVPRLSSRSNRTASPAPIFIAPVSPDAAIPSAPTEPYVGLDHFGLRVENMDEAVAELKRRGASFKMEPRTIRPGVRIAFVEAPDNVRIELLERS